MRPSPARFRIRHFLQTPTLRRRAGLLAFYKRTLRTLSSPLPFQSLYCIVMPETSKSFTRNTEACSTFNKPGCNRRRFDLLKVRANIDALNRKYLGLRLPYQFRIIRSPSLWNYHLSDVVGSDRYIDACLERERLELAL
jgi:hypothetical protein